MTDDLISRKTAIELMKKMFCKPCSDTRNLYNGVVCRACLIDDAMNAVEIVESATPTVDAVPVRHGKWIYGNEFHWYAASCSRCGYKRTTDIKAANWNAWKYCPNCGARMADSCHSDRNDRSERRKRRHETD